MARNARVTNDEFVRVWAVSNSTDEVVEKTKMSKVSVAARATSLRKAGVRLPKFSRGGRPVDVEGLNKILAEMGKEASPTTTGDDVVPIQRLTGRKRKPAKK